MEEYDHNAIEKKWQAKWEQDEIYKTPELSDKKKCYVLDMFPYPSGEGLHVGHPKGYIATDVFSRFQKMRGCEVLHPMGWDAFGLPAENFAIANKVHPRVAVEKNIARFKEQLKNIGLNYDWDREINTTDPAYYKWTQWIFLKLFEKGLAYESYEPINWCPSCQTGLANEDVEGGRCERCGTPVEKRPMRQWVLKITAYAERLLADLDGLLWPESIKESQRNWIGKSEGAEIKFKVESSKLKGGEITVFTTRPDTLFGATYLVLAPEHPFVEKLEPSISNWDEAARYILQAKERTEIERAAEGKEKTGVKLEGVIAVNPANKKEIPVFIADYVLPYYGTGAIMAVPAHDERDHAFAKKFRLKLTGVIAPSNARADHISEIAALYAQTDFLADAPILNAGILVNSAEFDGLQSEEAKKKITEAVRGKIAVTYKLRDWVFSRQRYWGEPIPIVHCETCGAVPVPEKDLPVTLPDVDHYEPTGTGESPLADIPEWVNMACPKCGGKAKRETNTMPQWAGSSWYYLRYIDPKNDEMLVDAGKEKYWSPVDMYVGGAEHATRHLIYARFWHKFLHDIGAVHYPEPFTRLQSVGLILAEDGRKMSKRYGNVINPDDIIERLGADTLRVYEMFMGPFGNAIAWSTDGLVGARRFLERVVRCADRIAEQATSADLERVMHESVKKISEDIESLKTNTAVSQLMIFANAMEKEPVQGRVPFETFLKLLAPFAPHLAEELWHRLGHTTSIHLEPWPEYDEAKVERDIVTIAVQVNGKVRGTFSALRGAREEELVEKALALPSVGKHLGGEKLRKTIVIPGKIVSFVTL